MVQVAAIERCEKTALPGHTGRVARARRIAAQGWGGAAVFLFCAILLAGIPGRLAVAGPSGSPIPISSLADLSLIGHDLSHRLDGWYVLTQNIDASPTASWDEGATTPTIVGFEPIGPWFIGLFDGQGHTIGGLTIDRPASSGIGLFAGLGPGGEVRDLALEGGSVRGGDYVGALVGTNNQGVMTGCYSTMPVTGVGDYVGGLVGYTYGTVSKCYTTGDVTGKRFVGGLIGQLEFSAILGGREVSQCYATGNVTATGSAGGLAGASSFGLFTGCYATGPVVTQAGRIGGLVGDNQAHSLIRRCYASGTVTGSTGSYVGGLVGQNADYSSVTQCYASGSVTGNGAFVGGFCGYLSRGTTTECYSANPVSGYGSVMGGFAGYSLAGAAASCYWNTEVAGLTTSAEGTGLSSAAMRQQATFAGWDFTTVWGIAENLSYPYLLGFPQPPAVPSNVSPAAGELGVDLRPALTATAFSDPNTTDTHARSQWQVRVASSPSTWTLTTFDSGPTTSALTSIVVSPALAASTQYWWRVRYADSSGLWSGWSTPTSFRTSLAAPTSITATNGTYEDHVHIVWTTSHGAFYYRVYRSARPEANTAQPITEWQFNTAYDDPVGTPNVEPHLLYYYWVRAASSDTGGSGSPFSPSDAGWAGAGWVLPSTYRGNIVVVH